MMKSLGCLLTKNQLFPMPEGKKNILMIIVSINIVVGIGLQYYGVQLISNNDKKLGYICMTLGLFVLFINAIIAIWKMKK